MNCSRPPPLKLPLQVLPQPLISPARLSRRRRTLYQVALDLAVGEEIVAPSTQPAATEGLSEVTSFESLSKVGQANQVVCFTPR